MQEQDKRAVESMCRCGLDIDVFPKFPREDIIQIYESAKKRDGAFGREAGISVNCS